MSARPHTSHVSAETTSAAQSAEGVRVTPGVLRVRQAFAMIHEIAARIEEETRQREEQESERRCAAAETDGGTTNDATPEPGSRRIAS